MSDACTAFLQWALPHLGMRWAGFRRVRGQVCKRVRRRIEALGLRDFEQYRETLRPGAGEWRVLDGLCRVTISRFCRDRGVFEALQRLLPKGPARLRCWSAGCASGEEPYTLSILARETGRSARILATDSDPRLLERARAARYPRSSVADLPEEWLAAAFTNAGDEFALRPEYRGAVEFRLQDLRKEMPDGPFDLVLCRNLAFTYYDEELQERILAGIRARLDPEGLLVTGRHETVPGMEPVSGSIYGNR